MGMLQESWFPVRTSQISSGFHLRSRLRPSSWDGDRDSARQLVSVGLLCFAVCLSVSECVCLRVFGLCLSKELLTDGFQPPELFRVGVKGIIRMKQPTFLAKEGIGEKSSTRAVWANTTETSAKARQKDRRDQDIPQTHQVQQLHPKSEVSQTVPRWRGHDHSLQVAFLFSSRQSVKTRSWKEAGTSFTDRIHAARWWVIVLFLSTFSQAWSCFYFFLGSKCNCKLPAQSSQWSSQSIPNLCQIGLELFSHQCQNRESDVLWITWSGDRENHCIFITKMLILNIPRLWEYLPVCLNLSPYMKKHFDPRPASTPRAQTSCRQKLQRYLP